MLRHGFRPFASLLSIALLAVSGSCATRAGNEAIISDRQKKRPGIEEHQKDFCSQVQIDWEAAGLGASATSPLLDLSPGGPKESYVDGDPAFEQNLICESAIRIEESANRRREAMQKAAQNGSPVPMQRDAHAKSVACVKATFRTLPKDQISDLSYVPSEGIFAPGQSYEAIVRFSNSNLVVTATDDNTPDARGMSVKLIGAAGSAPTFVDTGREEGARHNVDFTAVNVPTFVTADLYDYVHFVQGGRLKQAVFQNIKIPFTLLKYAPILISDRSMLADTYFSIGSYSFGKDRVAKWAFISESETKPRKEKFPKVTDKKNPDSRRSNIEQILKEQGVSFDFVVQKYVNEKDTPIEDYSVEWGARKSPFQKLGTLDIEPLAQGERLDSAERLAFCDALSFNSWRTTTDYRPLGNLHRARRVLYTHMAKVRHSTNATNYREPTSNEMP